MYLYFNLFFKKLVVLIAERFSVYFHISVLFRRRHFLLMIFSNYYFLGSLTTLARKCGTNWSETCRIQIFNPLMCFIPWKQIIYILELRTHEENKTTGFGHFCRVIDRNRGEGRMKQTQKQKTKHRQMVGLWSLST